MITLAVANCLTMGRLTCQVTRPIPPTSHTRNEGRLFGRHPGTLAWPVTYPHDIGVGPISTKRCHFHRTLNPVQLSRSLCPTREPGAVLLLRPAYPGSRTEVLLPDLQLRRFGSRFPGPFRRAVIAKHRY